MRTGQQVRPGRRARRAGEERQDAGSGAPDVSSPSGLTVVPVYPTSTIQRFASGDELGGSEADAGVTETLRRRQGAGRPLDRVDADRFGGGFGADLSGVRVHTDGEADTVARSVQSVAFTYGRDVYFTKGSYAPGTDSGDHLLAHELAHVVQGSSGRWASSGSGVQIGRADDPAESAADAAADAVMAQLRHGERPDPVVVGGLPKVTGEPVARTVRRAGIKSLAKKVKKAFTGKKRPKGRKPESRTLGGATMSQLRALSDAQQGHTGSSSKPPHRPAKQPAPLDMDFDDAKSELDDDDDFLFDSAAEDDGLDDFAEDSSEAKSEHAPETDNYSVWDTSKFEAKADDSSELSSSEDSDEDEKAPVPVIETGEQETKDTEEDNYSVWDTSKFEAKDDDSSEISSSEDSDEDEKVVIPEAVIPPKQEAKDAEEDNYSVWDTSKFEAKDDDDDDSELSASEDSDEDEKVVIPPKQEAKEDVKAGGKEKPKANYSFWDGNKFEAKDDDDDDLSISEDSDSDSESDEKAPEPVVEQSKQESKNEGKEKPKANYNFFDPNKVDDLDDDDLSISEDSEEPVVIAPVKTKDKKKGKKAPKFSNRVKKGKHRAFMTRDIASGYANEREVSSDEARKVMENAALMIRTAQAIMADIQAGEKPLKALHKERVSKELGDAVRSANGDSDKAVAALQAFIEDRIEFCRRQEIPLTDDLLVGDTSDRRVHYDSEEEQKQSLVTIKDGKLVRAGGEVVDTGKSSTFFSGNGVEIFVASESGEIHMASHKVGKYHHSSLLAGSQVAIGGEMKVTGGKIEWITNKSGHYTPSKDHLVQFLHWLGKDGMDLKSIQVKAGFGVPGGRTAEDIARGVTEYGMDDDKEGFDTLKLRAVLAAYEEQFGTNDESVEKFIKSKGWFMAIGGVHARNGHVTPKEVIKALKVKFGVPTAIAGLGV